MAIVLDASVTAAWLLPDEFSPVAEACRNALLLDTAIVPAIWPLEVANALLVLARRRKLTESERQTGLGWLRGLPLRIDQDAASLAFSQLSELASAYQLSVYDAAYLELAQRRKLALGCKDGPLRKAAKHAGVTLWE